jgi:hypothetical protein
VSQSRSFSTRAIAILAATLLILFAASLLLTGGGGRNADTSGTIGANGYSHSSIGYAGLFDMLRRLERPVLHSQSETLAKLGRGGVLILTEPPSGLTAEANRTKFLNARATLLILPKWFALANPERDDWLGAATLLPEAVVTPIFTALEAKGTVVRVPAVEAYQSNKLAHKPTIQGSMQLIKDSTMTPLIDTPDGILLGEIKRDNRVIWVLADPDPLENHGLGVGDNADFANDVIEGLRQTGGKIVFDETIHGFVASAKTPLSVLFAYPFNIVAGQALVAVALLLLAATRRFGVARPGPGKPRPGTWGLIANAARLMEFGGFQAALLRRYGQLCVQDTARLLRAPGGLGGAELMNWLDRATKLRGSPVDCRALVAEMETAAVNDLARLLRTVRELYFWKRELTHGSVRRSSDYRRDFD